MQRLIQKEVDINSFPIPDPRMHASKQVQLTQGDSHANALKTLWTLLFHDIISLKKGQKDYDDFKFIYYRPVRLWKKSTVKKLREIIDNISVTDLAKVANSFMRFIGDDLSDRGQLDFIMLLIYQKLHKENVDFTVLLSNHGIESVCCYETGNLYGSEIVLGDEKQRKSAVNMQKLINKGIITRKEVDEIIEKCYLPHLKLIDYTFAEDGSITYYGHAPFGDNTLDALAKELDVEIIADKAKQCDALNLAFDKLKKEEKVNEIYYKEKALYEFVWNRDRTTLERTPQNRYVNGHDTPMSDKQIAKQGIELNNILGKYGRKDAVNSYEVLCSHESPHDKNNSYLTTLLTTLQTNQTFKETVEILKLGVNFLSLKELALCGIEWVIKFQLTAQKVNHVNKIFCTSISPSSPFG